MQPDDIALVQASFAVVVPIQDTVAALFYGHLFQLEPQLKPLFPSDLKEQGRKLMAMLQLAVTELSEPATFAPVVQESGRRHVGYGVQAGDYARLGAALLWSLEHSLGEQFTAAHAKAWSEVYTVLANMMLDAAAEATA